VTSINKLLANEIQDMFTMKWVFHDLHVLARKLASPFGHPTQVSTQVELATTRDYLRVRLPRALKTEIARFPVGFCLKGVKKNVRNNVS